MKTCCYFLTLVFVIFTFNSCSNKIEVLAGYQENASIYGLLDPSHSIQFIKINKVFINPGKPADSVAKIADSLFFDTLAPTLTEVASGRVINLYKANILLKDNGLFATSPNYLYATKEKIYAKQVYRLDMRLPKTQKYVTATTNVTDSLRLIYPANVLASPSVTDIPLDGKYTIIFNTIINSKIFDGYFHFNYLEVNKADTNIKVVKTLKWRLFNKYRADDITSVQSISQRITTTSFYDLLLNNIPVDPSLERRFLLCKLELTAGNLELDNYIQATEPSIGIVQKQTEYTNIINGIGIFASSRSSTYNNIAIGNATKTSIIKEPDYKKLGFVF